MHIAIIMDGNGRWAKKRGLQRNQGHRKGVEVVRAITTHLAKKKEIKVLSLFAFSTENWQRPKFEVDFLIRLLEKYLNDNEQVFLENDICFRAIGDLNGLSKNLQKKLISLQEKTQKCTRLILNLAINYGGKNEIVRAVKRLMEKQLPVSEQNIQNHLDLKESVDLLIRTSNEIRISNFLLWQCAYAEMFFANVDFPDFTVEELEKALKNFNQRARKFGTLEPSIKNPEVFD